MRTTMDRRALFGMAGASFMLGFSKRARADDAPPATLPPRPSIETYARTPEIDQIALSPDGKRIAFITQDGDVKYLIHFYIAEEKPQRLKIGPVKIRNIFFADNDHVVVVNSVTDALPQFAGNKHEFSIAQNLNLNTGKVKPLFFGQEGFYAMVHGDLSRIKVDGQYRITASNYRMESDYPLCLYSFGMDNTNGHSISEGTRDTEGWLLTPEGHPLAYSEFDDDHKIWSLFYNMAEPGKSSHYKLIYKVHEAISYPDLVGLGRDGKSLVIKLYTDKTGGDYHEISADGVISEPLDPEGGDKSHVALFHPTTWRLVGFSRRDDWFTYDYFDPLMKKLMEAIPQVMGADYRTSIVDFAEDPRKMIVYSESANDAGSYSFIDFSTGSVILLEYNYPDIGPEWTTQKKAIDYKAADGLNIHAYLTLPPRMPAKALPLVVLPHGGPLARDYIDFDWQVQALASLGYAVLQPNFRGSSGYGDAFAGAGDGEFGRKMQTDLSDGVRYLVAQGTVDARRVAILGASYGGYAALAGATLDPGVYNCAVAIAGVSDPKSFIDFVAENNNWERDSTEVLVWQQRMGDPKHYDEISPVKQAAKASCPILLIHGTDDTVVPIDQSQRMERALKAAGKAVEFITYKGQDHWETRASSRVAMMQAAVDFLAKYNPAT